MAYLPIAVEALHNLHNAIHVHVEESLTLAERIRREGVSVPSGEELLPDWSFRFRDFSIDAAKELGLLFGSTETKFMRRLVIYEWLKYRDIEEGNQKIRWGVAIRVRMNVRKLSSDVSVANIFNLAAAAHAQMAETTVEVDNLGVASESVESAIPVINALTMQSFTDLQHAYTKALPELTRQKNVTFTPRILAIWGEEEPEETISEGYKSSIAIGWALSNIADGRTLKRALNKGTAEFQRVVKQVYEEFAEIASSDVNKSPSAVNRAKASEILGGFKMR